MATFRSLDSIILSMLDFIRLVQPDADTKPGTVFRDVAVDAPSQEIARLYSDLRGIANLQSYTSASGTSLDKLASNFSAVRGAGSPASGTIVVTLSSIDSDLSIPANTAVTARNGFRYKTLTSNTISANNSGIYRANASRLRTDLDAAGISDEYALEIPVSALSPGASGNIGKYSIVSINTPGISNVTNVLGFTGGSNSETDSAFRARILSIFAGSNIGTALGYINALKADTRVIDVLSVEPGDPLMTRDGSQIGADSDGNPIVITPGTGGKADLYVQGTANEEATESFIYRDLSGRADATNPRNDYIIGQRGLNDELNFQQRRRTAIRAGTLPLQPVTEVVTVTGSLSGSNFQPKSVDVNGNVTGNYELALDTGAYAGSPFGFDKLKWIDTKITLPDEVITKGVFNGQDATAFTDVLSFPEIHQSISIKGEAATISSNDRTSIRINHTPVLAVDRVFNATTGERYVVENSNPDGVPGEPNETGYITISGNTLPIATDNIEVSYLWDHIHDPDVDFDDLTSQSIFRTVQDSIDWGYSNRIELESTTLAYSVQDGYYVLTQHPASRVIDVYTLEEETATNTSGSVVVSSTIINVLDIVDSTSGKEYYNTKVNNGSFSGNQISLPTDTTSNSGDSVVVRYNLVDHYSPDGEELGTFTGNQINIPNTSGLSVGTTMYVNYIADLGTILPTTAISALPATGNNNAFTVSGDTVGTQPITNIYSGSTIVSNVRFAPSYLRINLQGTSSRGRLNISGHSFTRIEDIVTVTSNGFTIDLQSSIINSMGISSVPTSGFVAKLESVERVTVANDIVDSIDYTFDTLNYELKDRRYSDEYGFTNSSLSRTQVKLPASIYNAENELTTGQKLRVIYYYCDLNQQESLVAGSSGLYFSRFKYAYVNSISLSSGFTNTSGTVTGNITITSANQPQAGTGYFATYSYTAPKEGERISLKYTYNKLITDSTFTIEAIRPITADVLIKQAQPLDVDVVMLVVFSSSITDTTPVAQSLEQTIISYMTATGLNTTLDASDIISISYRVPGVDRVILTTFNESGSTGVLKTIEAGRNQYIRAGTISIIKDSR